MPVAELVQPAGALAKAVGGRGSRAGWGSRPRSEKFRIVCGPFTPRPPVSVHAGCRQGAARCPGEAQPAGVRNDPGAGGGEYESSGFLRRRGPRLLRAFFPRRRAFRGRDGFRGDRPPGLAPGRRDAVGIVRLVGDQGAVERKLGAKVAEFRAGHARREIRPGKLDTFRHDPDGVGVLEIQRMNGLSEIHGEGPGIITGPNIFTQRAFDARVFADGSRPGSHFLFSRGNCPRNVRPKSWRSRMGHREVIAQK